MRLLQCNSSGQVILTKDYINHTPPFAILSHRWGVNESEVTFRDIRDGYGEDKAGYEKIRFCAKQAKADGLQYFWIDTCCIDRSSSTELAEAINSMFKWYSDAAKCYVYLSDVSALAPDAFRGPDLKRWESEFRESEWFTRGWTLQELVAPRIVEFFSREHYFLGDKKSLEEVIHGITSIPLEALRDNRSLQDFSIEERMSWAQGRDTTRHEDAAYCLWGIFDVQMPLIYGEGRAKALSRLWKEIRETQDLPQVSSTEPRAEPSMKTESRRFKNFSSSFSDAPVDLLPIHFMEREQETDLIRTAHQDSEENAPPRCAIWGIPGVGKTQLAIRYTKSFIDDPAISAVFWMSCSTKEKLYQGFSRLLNLIEHPDQFRQEQDARIIAARRWLEQPEVSGIVRWLLVLDNVDITTLDFLRENLPRQGKRGRILFTTRTEATARAVCKTSGNLQLFFELEPPVVDKAVMLFFKSAGINEETVSNDSRSQVTTLMGCLGCLPFAIDHAASFMTQSSKTVKDFTELYLGDQKSYIFRWKNMFSAYEVKSISGMFESHLHDLKQSHPEVYGLLNILVFWDPDRIEFEEIKVGALFLGTSSEPTKEISSTYQNWDWARWVASSVRRALYLGLGLSNKSSATDTYLAPSKDILPFSELESLIEMMSSEVQLETALQQLQMLSLIKRRSALDGGAYRIHDLTQKLVQHALESEGAHLKWLRYAIAMACGAFRQIQHPTLPENWSRCEGIISHILSLAEYSRSISDNNADLLKARGNIAMYWCHRGRYYEARDAYQQLIGFGNDVFEDAEVEIYQWKLGLAEANWHLSDHIEAAKLYDEALQLQEAQLGADHPDVLRLSEKLGLVYRSQARYGEARSMLRHVFASRKRSLGPDHLDTVQAMENLAMVINSGAEAEKDRSQYPEAESLHKQALIYRTAQLGADHLDSLWTADNLGTNYRAQGRYQEAAEIYEKVLEGRTSKLGEDHPQVLWTVANLASAYTSLSCLDKAEIMYERAIAGNEQRLGNDHTETLYAVEGLADCYHQQSRLEQAESLYDRALRGMQGRLGIAHPSVMRLMHKMANLYRDRQEFTESIVLFEELIELRKSVQRSSNPELLRTYNDLAASYIGVGKYAEAEKCYRLELAGSHTEHGGLHVETKKREDQLASFLKDQELQSQSAKDKGNVERTVEE